MNLAQIIGELMRAADVDRVGGHIRPGTVVALPAQAKTKAEKVLWALKEGPLDVHQILDRVGGTMGSLSVTLSYLKMSMQIERVERGVYRLPD